MRFGYPILLDLSHRSVVVIGGGPVAARKVHGLLAGGAGRIKVVFGHFHESMSVGIERIEDDYDPKHLDGADLVIAAAESADLNAQVIEDARIRGILASRADEEEDHAGDFVSPAVHRDGVVIVAVAAGSPALSSAIRDGIAARFDARWTRMADAMRILRPRIRDDANLSPARRRAIFRDLADEDALAAATAGPEHVWKWLVSKHPDLARHTITTLEG